MHRHIRGRSSAGRSTTLVWAGLVLSCVVAVGLADRSDFDSVLPFGLSWETPLADVATTIPDREGMITSDAAFGSVRSIEWTGGEWFGESIETGVAIGDPADDRLSRVTIVMIPDSPMDHVGLFRRTAKRLGKQLGTPYTGYSLDKLLGPMADAEISERADALKLLDKWILKADSLRYIVKIELKDSTVTVEFTVSEYH